MWNTSAISPWSSSDNSLSPNQARMKGVHFKQISEKDSKSNHELSLATVEFPSLRILLNLLGDARIHLIAIHSRSIDKDDGGMTALTLQVIVLGRPMCRGICHGLPTD